MLSRQHILWFVVGAGAIALAVVFALRRDRAGRTDTARSSGPAATADSKGSSNDAAHGGFRDVAPESGLDFRMQFLPDEQGEKFKINLYDHGCGVAVADYNGDGYDDIYLLNQLGPNALYRNKGDGTFVKVSPDSGGVALGDRICVGAVFGDFDNDHDQDLYVTSTRGGNVLFENIGNDQFRDITEQAGLKCIAHSQTATFWDYDNDGDLDLYVTNSAKWTTDEYDQVSHFYRGLRTLWELTSSPKEYNILYRNNGNGTFTDVTETARLGGQGWGGDVAVVDYDEDGYLDLFVTNMFGFSQLYHNDRDGTFSDVTSQTLKRTSWGAIGSKFFDFNNDGRLDLIVADMHSDMWMPFDYDVKLIDEKRKYPSMFGPKGSDEQAERAADRLRINYFDFFFGNTLYKNLGGGQFEEVSSAANMETFWPWGVATGDFDNDGFEDVFLPSGMGYPFFYWRNMLMMNRGNGQFEDAGVRAGIEPPRGGIYQEQEIGGRQAPRSSRCAATADFDHDGRLDLVVNNFNDRVYYYRNEFPRRNSVSFRLKGTQSNPDAIGALVRIWCGSDQMVRQVHAAGGYLSQSSKTVHFGIAEHSKVDRVEIVWPSGRRQQLGETEINRLHEIVEPAAGTP
jgi:hypothetical protein